MIKLNFGEFTLEFTEATLADSELKHHRGAMIFTANNPFVQIKTRFNDRLFNDVAIAIRNAKHNHFCNNTIC